MFKSIPLITRNLLIINIICYLAQMVVMQHFGGGEADILSFYGGLHFFLDPFFQPYQLITYMFLHGSWGHLLMNMFALWMFGRSVEPALGEKKFLIFYFVCGIGAGLCQELLQFVQLYMNVFDGALTVGASGAVYGILLAFGMLWPNERILLLIPPIPMKAKYFVMLYAVIELFSAFSTNSNVAHFAHLGGMAFGWLMFRYWRNKERLRDERIRQRFTTPQRPATSSAPPSYTPPPASPDQEFRARQQAKEDAVDRILDKIRQSGYDSLTPEEKRDLFDNSRR